MKYIHRTLPKKYRSPSIFPVRLYLAQGPTGVYNTITGKNIPLYIKNIQRTPPKQYRGLSLNTEIKQPESKGCW